MNALFAGERLYNVSHLSLQDSCTNPLDNQGPILPNFQMDVHLPDYCYRICCYSYKSNYKITLFFRGFMVPLNAI